MVTKSAINNVDGKTFSGLVSVLICAYNVEKYIEECLQAVLNQTYCNLEIIIVDDGSTDATLSILEKFAAQDNRIKIVQNKSNLGFIASLNRGLSFCTGEFIARTDADDIVVLDWIATILQHMVKDNSIIAMGGNLEIFSPKNVEWSGGRLAKRYKNGEIWQAPLAHNDICKKMFFGNPIHNNCMIMRAEVYRKHNLTFDENYRYAEDYKFWFEVSKLGKLANVNKTLVKYRVHPQQTSSVHNKNQMQIAKKIKREIFNYYFADAEKNIDFMDNIEIKHIEHIFLIAQDKVFRQKLAYELYCSLSQYNFSAFKTFLFKHFRFFTFKQNRRIFKRFLRPHKYEKNI